MSDRPGRHEMTEILDYLSEHSTATAIVIFQELQRMASAYGDEWTLRVVDHWLGWRKESPS